MLMLVRQSLARGSSLGLQLTTNASKCASIASTKHLHINSKSTYIRQYSMASSNLPKIPGRKRKRVGRGPGSGIGKRSGRGMKGYAARHDRSTPYRAFEGGTGISKAIPKLG